MVHLRSETAHRYEKIEEAIDVLNGKERFLRYVAE